MPGQMVDPPFLSQLGHDRIDPREACLALCPLCQGFGVPVPGDLYADGIPLHAIKLWVVGGCCVEELPPQKLSVQREGGCAVPLHLWRGNTAGHKHSKTGFMKLNCEAPMHLHTFLKSATDHMPDHPLSESPDGEVRALTKVHSVQ